MQIWTQVLLKSIALFTLVLVLVRMMGKRNITHMPLYRYVSYQVMAIIAALISVNMITNPVIGFIALGAWFFLPILLDYLSLKSKRLHDLINGKETILIKHGKIMEENLLKTGYTGEELLRELRTKNIFSMADVEFAVMEATGEINVFPKSDKKPVTAHDLGIKTAPQGWVAGLGSPSRLRISSSSWRLSSAARSRAAFRRAASREDTPCSTVSASCRAWARVISRVPYCVCISAFSCV